MLMIYKISMTLPSYERSDPLSQTYYIQADSKETAKTKASELFVKYLEPKIQLDVSEINVITV